MADSNPGTVWLVGAGPGDPGLLTRRGEDLLRRAQVVVHDHLVHHALLDLAPEEAERVYVGKTAGHCAMTQDAINALMVERARRGLRVVRLKGGDPNVFGRGAEEAEALAAAGVPFQVVPGVTAALGVAAYAGLPLTHRQDSSAVAVVTGHGDPDRPDGRIDWSAMARFPGTLVVYMAVAHLRSLCDRLVREGKAPHTPAALVHAGTWPRQCTVVGTLADLADRVEAACIGPPGLLIVGAVVARREKLAWFERLPLFGRTIVVTRPRDEAAASADALQALGAEVLLAPTVTIGPVADPGPMDQAIDRIDDYDWIVFTSANGVRAFLGRILDRGQDLRRLGRARLAAIGPATAQALESFHLRADLVPPEFRSESLAEALQGAAAGTRVLLARADRGRAILREELAQVARVDQVAVYSNADAERLPDEVARRLEEGSVDWITLTSPAITRRLHALLGEAARRHVGTRIRLASISPVTTAAAAELGWTIAAEANPYTVPALVEAIVQANSR